jgi:hypothetical protein
MNRRRNGQLVRHDRDRDRAGGREGGSPGRRNYANYGSEFLDDAIRSPAVRPGLGNPSPKTQRSVRLPRCRPPTQQSSQATATRLATLANLASRYLSRRGAVDVIVGDPPSPMTPSPPSGDAPAPRVHSVLARTTPTAP